MKVWVFVEGRSDCLALDALWGAWKNRLRVARHGIALIPLDDKSRFFRKIGHRAAEKLIDSPSDLVVGLPDLYPNDTYVNTEYRHSNLSELQEVQQRLVAKALREVFGRDGASAGDLLRRFYPSALKHDLEMLLLAAKPQLQSYLRTTDDLDCWHKPVEEQNQQTPPKRIVEDLFRTKRRWYYRDTLHAPAILRKVTDLRQVFSDDRGQAQCPVFQAMVDWVQTKTGVPAY